jgi:hypothetical protein
MARRRTARRRRSARTTARRRRRCRAAALRRRRRCAAAIRAGRAAAPAVRRRRSRCTLSDYKVVNGVKLPHLITRGTNGQTAEEWTIKSYKINPNFKGNTFTK